MGFTDEEAPPRPLTAGSDDPQELRENALDPAVRQADLRDPTRSTYRRTDPLRLGLLTFVSHEGRDPAQALHDGLNLFQEADQLGYSIGLVRVRHFQPYLSGPVAFLSAASQWTERLRLGTAVIPFHAEDPIRLAEEVSNLDLISKGRVELGLAATRFEPGVYSRWATADWSKQAVWDRIEEFLSLLAGEPIPAAHDVALPGVPPGSPVRLTPIAPGLRDRIWAGPGTLASAEKTALLRLKLQVSSLNTEDVGLRFEPSQYDQIALYRATVEQHHPEFLPEVNASRTIFPLLGSADDDAIRASAKHYIERLYPDGRHRIETTRSFRYSHPALGTVDEIVQQLRTDVALAAADNLIVLVPSTLPFEVNRRLLRVIAGEIRPALDET